MRPPSERNHHDRVVFAVAALAASFALNHYASKVIEKKVKRALNKKIAEQNAPRQLTTSSLEPYPGSRFLGRKERSWTPMTSI